ncbi:hypothetical protein KUCAC02_011814, partial [Chaenocephalus aceratus]
QIQVKLIGPPISDPQKFDDHWLSNEKTHDVGQIEKHEMKFSDPTEDPCRPQGVSVPCNTTSTSEENNQDHIIKRFFRGNLRVAVDGDARQVVPDDLIDCGGKERKG